MKPLLIASAALILSSVIANAQSINGTVKKIDDAQGKLTIDHGPIKNLDMDSMTMVFRVKDAAMLEGLAPGTRVRFRAEEGEGGYVVTRLQAVKEK